MFILAHNSSKAFGGGEIGTVLLLAGLQRRGHRVLMLFRDAENAKRAASYGIPTGVQRVGGDAMLPDAGRLAARLRREAPDAVILTTFKKVFLSGLGARMAGAPFVVQRIVLQGDTPARGARYRLALRRWVDRVVLNAGAMRAPFLAGDPSLDPSRVVTILDGVRAPVRGREPGAVRRELGIPADALVVGSVARLAGQKRFDRLLRALALLPEPVHCIIAGDGPAMEGIRAVAAELGMADRVHLAGFRRDVGDVLDAMDVFAVSSDREGFANAMLEAMAFGIPVVSTDVSGAREALDAAPGEPRAGIVTGFDEAELAEAIGGLLRDGDARRRMGDAARERAERRFGEGRFLDEWERLLRDGVRAGRRGG
ncbi:MAG TPA: glycosyltransferase [Longimicrobium sp.]|nr:glycosyltransferase [Longimicrobium sp.]